MGYLDTKQKIIETLTGRVAGTQIQPSEHQEFALSLLEYIRSVELISGSTLIGIAERNTVPVQPDNSRACYIAGVAQNQTVVFENFIDENGNPISLTTGDMEGVFIILLWNTQYWSAQTFSTNIISQSESATFYYRYNIRKTYESIALMNADVASPIGTDGKYIKVGDIVTVVNSTTPSENGVYSYKGTTDGWKFQSSFNFQVEQIRSQNTNTAPSSKLFDNELVQLQSDLRTVSKQSFISDRLYFQGLTFWDYSKFNSVDKTNLGGWTSFGDEVGKILQGVVTTTYKAEINLTPTSQHLVVLLRGLKYANIPFRSFCIYDLNGNIIKEGAYKGDAIFIATQSVIIEATCDDIMTFNAAYSGLMSINEKLNQNNIDLTNSINKKLNQNNIDLTNSIKEVFGYKQISKTYSVTQGSNAMSISLMSPLSLKSYVHIRVNCLDGSIERYRIISSDGKFIQGNTIYYPVNEDIYLTVKTPEFAGKTWGAYTNAVDVLSDGTVTVDVEAIDYDSIINKSTLFPNISGDCQPTLINKKNISGRRKLYARKSSGIISDIFYSTLESYKIDISDVDISSIRAIGTNYNSTNYDNYSFAKKDGTYISGLQSSLDEINIIAEDIPADAKYIYINGKLDKMGLWINGIPVNSLAIETEITETKKSAVQEAFDLVGADNFVFNKNNYDVWHNNSGVSIEKSNGNYNLNANYAALGTTAWSVSSIKLGTGADLKGKTLYIYSSGVRTFQSGVITKNNPSSWSTGYMINIFDATKIDIDGGVVYKYSIPSTLADTDILYFHLGVNKSDYDGNTDIMYFSYKFLKKYMPESKWYLGLDIPVNSTEENKLLTGKTFWSIWDSLGHNTWQEHFSEISGAKWYSELNAKADKPISYGGTSSEPSTDDGSQQRAINLVSYKDTYPIDIITFENINDRALVSLGGSIDDAPFMRSQKITYTVAGEEFSSYDAAKAYAQSNMQSIIASVLERKRGTIISVPYTSGSSYRGSMVKFTSAPTAEGDISITIHSTVYSVHVTPDMTIQDIVDSFILYSFGAGWRDRDNGDGSISIYYYTDTTNRATFDGGSTGVAATISDTTGGGSYTLYFTGDDIDDTTWQDESNWKTSVTLYSIYKGLIEYIKTNLPSALFYFVFPFSVGVDFASSEFKHGDGTWSMDKFKTHSIYSTAEALYNIQRECAKYYGVPCLELGQEGGMDITNIEHFFNTNNVHPKQAGYDRYAETIYKLIK